MVETEGRHHRVKERRGNASRRDASNTMFNPFKLLDPDPKRAEPVTDFAGFQRDPFEAVPVKNEHAEFLEDSQSCYQLKMRLSSKPGFLGRLSERLGLHRDVRVDLDSRGSFFWSQVDGSQDLRSIEKKIREQFSLSLQESREATILFTKMLMLRHLIQLELKTEN